MITPISGVWWIENDGPDTDGPCILIEVAGLSKRYARFWVRSEEGDVTWCGPEQSAYPAELVWRWNPDGNDRSQDAG